MKAQNQSEAKFHNRNLILELLIRKSPISRIELSKITGLSKMTVTNIIYEMCEEEIIEEAGSEDTALGRKPIALKVKEKSRLFAGIYISREYLYVVVGDLCGEIIYKEKTKTPSNEDKFISEIYRLLDKVITERIQIIGVSSVGPIDYKEGIILNPPNFHGIKNIHIVNLLEKRYDRKVVLDRDTNASALAEWLYGKARTVSDYLYVGVTNGIGAAIVSEDRIYRGESGFGGEIGHVTIDINGKKCSCGNIGCLELYASIKEGKKFDLQKSCRYLASGLVTLINLFDPSVIYLGHEIARKGDEAAKILEGEIAKRYISREKKQVSVEISEFGEFAPVYGSVAVAVCEYIGKR